MPLYITRGNFTAETIKRMMAKPEDRSESIGKFMAAAGGKLHAYYYTFGEYDFMIIGEAPSEKEAMAAGIVSAGTGSVTNLNTTVAVTSADAKAIFAKAASLAAQFRPAGT